MTSRSTRRLARSPAFNLSVLPPVLAAGLGALRLTTAPLSGRVFVPVLATAIAGWAAASLTDAGLARRVGSCPARAAIVLSTGTLAAGLVCAWSTVPAATWHGLPTATTLRALYHDFYAAGSVIRSNPTPLPPAQGIVLCLSAGAGLCAAATRSLLSCFADGRSSSGALLVALVPSFGMWSYTCVLSSGAGRLPASLSYFLSSIAYLAIADTAVRREKRVAFSTSTERDNANGGTGGRPMGVRARRSVARPWAALKTTALAVITMACVAPSFAGMQLSALPYSGGSRPAPGEFGSQGYGGIGFTGTGGGTMSTLALIADLHALLARSSKQLMFTATSPQPTYWQVATLTRYDGGEWTPDFATQLAYDGNFSDKGSPPAPAVPILEEPKAQSTYTTSVTLNSLLGPLVPVPPDTISVSSASATNLTLVPGIGALERDKTSSSSSSSTYSSLVRLSTGDPTTNESPAGSLSGDDITPYLSLPMGEIAQPVITLAHQIVAGTGGDPAQEALALARYFGNPAFHYTLDPPNVPGADPLSAFLFVTKAGFCQQFAGAFAVLARLDGLPTRLAVGFSAGTPYTKKVKGRESPITTYKVTGADAHVWPEVYLGPQSGWVSFEPTPADDADPQGVGVVSSDGIAAAPTPMAISTPATTLPTTPTTPIPSNPRSTRAPGGGPGILEYWPYALMIAAVVAACGVAVVRRNRRSRRARSPGSRSAVQRSATNGHPRDAIVPRDEVLARYRDAATFLGRTGIGRNKEETIGEHLERVERAMRADGLHDVGESFRELSCLAELASYSDSELSKQEAERSRVLFQLLVTAAEPQIVFRPVGARSPESTAKRPTIGCRQLESADSRE